jgi:hypothetical protein
MPLGRPGAAVSERNRSFSVAPGSVIVLVAVAPLVAILAS